MSWLYRRLIRPVLFAQEAEQVHERTMCALGWISRHQLACDAFKSFYSTPALPIEVFGLKFPNPIGVAAGMDKYANALPAWEALGFGFSELGGVTWHPQPGNPRPRLFRVIPDQAIINRMGFNNPGAEALQQKLVQWRASGRWPLHPVGINLGKSKITALAEAPQDYANSFRVLRAHADFFVVNVSSPNTPGLRQLQDKSALDEILAAIQEVQKESVECGVSSDKISPSQPGTNFPLPRAPRHSTLDTRPRPILVKVSPDLSFDALDEILDLAPSRGIAGIVATNTTTARPETSDERSRRIYAETGGLSGKPLRARSTEIIRHIYQRTLGKLAIIGVGGLFNAEDAWEKIAAGASLLQLYTGLVYQGPSIVSDIVRGLLARMEAEGIANIRQATGSAHKIRLKNLGS
jgi:dihydroorotate dehydrogenase